MLTEWKPGDLARFNKRGGFERIPGVVIDPASLRRPRDGGEADYDAAALARTLRLLADADSGGPYTYRADIVRELADIIAGGPPKPEEPTGLGAVVEDAEGRTYIRTADVDCHKPWSYANNFSDHTWDDVAAVKILSEGVQ